jgi:hypothetical protein
MNLPGYEWLKEEAQSPEGRKQIDEELRGGASSRTILRR